MFYLRVEESIPPYDNITKLAQYYKKYWNTSKGKANVEDVIRNYNKFVGYKKPTIKKK